MVLMLNIILEDRVIFLVGIITLLVAIFTRPRRKKLLRNDSSSIARKKQSFDPREIRRTTNIIRNCGGGNNETIADKFQHLSDVRQALRDAGLIRANLILGIDFSISNIHQGKETFGYPDLHRIFRGHNPYQQVIETLGQTLEPFDKDGIIPTFGFGHNKSYNEESLFLFDVKGGSKDVLSYYKKNVSKIDKGGPTDLAPLIYKAIKIVKETKQYHILVIITDGQITCKESTCRAIREASVWPLSIICIGVGDGPWDMMHNFDTLVQGSLFDNFQFVNYHEIQTKYKNPKAAFALFALMEIPDQYRFINDHLLNNL